MIRSNAWGSLSSDAVSSVTESYSQSHEHDYDDDQELMDTEEYSMTSYEEGRSLSDGESVRQENYESDHQHGHDIQRLPTAGMWKADHNDNISYSSPSASSWQGHGGDFGAGLAGTGSLCNNDMPLIPTIHPDIDQLNVSVRRPTRDQGLGGDDDEDINTMVDTDGAEDHLPELTVSFTDPEGCHFDEILYWVCLCNAAKRNSESSRVSPVVVY